MSQAIRYSIFKSSVVFASLALLTSGAYAAPSTESFTLATTIENDPTSGQFVLPDFDSSLGDLENVHLTLNIWDCALFGVDNTGTTPVAFTDASVSLPFSLTGPGYGLDTAFTSSIASGIAQPGANTFKTAQLYSAVRGSVASADLGLWESQPGGTISLDYTKGTLSFGGTDPGDSLVFSGNEHAYTQLTVTYTYIGSTTLATPEPPGKLLSLMVAGAMFGLIVFRKRFLAP